MWSLVLAACSIGSKGGFEEENSSPCSQLFQNPYSNFHPLAVILHTFLFTQLPILVSDLAFQLHPSNLLILIPNLCSPSVQFSCSVTSNSLPPHGLQHARPSCPSPTWMSLLKLLSIESVMPSNHLILCCLLLLPPSVIPSIRICLNESVLCIRWPKYWSFSFNISPSSEYSGLISFWMDWLDLLAVQGTLNSLLQHHSSKASILQRSAFLAVQLSHPYMTTGKTVALTRWTFVGNVSAF